MSGGHSVGKRDRTLFRYFPFSDRFRIAATCFSLPIFINTHQWSEKLVPATISATLLLELGNSQNKSEAKSGITFAKPARKNRLDEFQRNRWTRYPTCVARRWSDNCRRTETRTLIPLAIRLSTGPHDRSSKCSPKLLPSLVQSCSG